MTDREAEVLEELVDQGWVAPIRFGGSGHNGVAKVAFRMAPKGWTEWRFRGQKPFEPVRGMARGSREYRITSEGRQALANHRLTASVQS